MLAVTGRLLSGGIFTVFGSRLVVVSGVRARSADHGLDDTRAERMMVRAVSIAENFR